MDIFYTSSPEPQDEAASTTGGVAGASASVAPDHDLDAKVQEALRRVVIADSAEWIPLLEQAGFSHAEAGRLVFERMRPRDEGLVRNPAAV